MNFFRGYPFYRIIYIRFPKSSVKDGMRDDRSRQLLLDIFGHIHKNFNFTGNIIILPIDGPKRKGTGIWVAWARFF